LRGYIRRAPAGVAGIMDDAADVVRLQVGRAEASRNVRRITPRATSTLRLSSELNGRTENSLAKTLILSKTIFQGRWTWIGVRSSFLFGQRFTGFSQQQFS
jgi:hypothetical protein